MNPTKTIFFPPPITRPLVPSSNSGASPFKEVSENTSRTAFFIGLGVILAAFFLGRSYAFYIGFIILSLAMSLLWIKKPRPLLLLVLITATVPIAISQQQVTCNLLLTTWILLLKPVKLFQLQKWHYIAILLFILGILTSSFNWLQGDPVRSILRQGAFAYNFAIGPFLFLPAAFMIMKHSQNNAANLKGLLFYLIVPATVILVIAKLFGTLINAWEASQHVQSLAEGFYKYQLGKVTVDYLRTQIGFILAILICASTAIATNPVKRSYRMTAWACWVANVLLLMVTGSFGSALSCFCGMGIIIGFQLNPSNTKRIMASIMIICILALISYGATPPEIKQYLTKRFEHRILNADTDRLFIWKRALKSFVRNPEGVGFTMAATLETGKHFVHNDYLVYAISYGFFGCLAYVVLVVGIFITLISRRKKFKDPSGFAVYLSSLGSIVCLSLNNMTDHMAGNRFYFTVIWSLIWYSYACSLSPTETEAPSIQNQNPGNGVYHNSPFTPAFGAPFKHHQNID